MYTLNEIYYQILGVLHTSYIFPKCLSTTNKNSILNVVNL